METVRQITKAVLVVFFTLSQLFALRPKLPKIKKALLPLRAADPNAPKRFTLHLEIHSNIA